MFEAISKLINKFLTAVLFFLMLFGVWCCWRGQETTTETKEMAQDVLKRQAKEINDLRDRCAKIEERLEMKVSLDTRCTNEIQKGNHRKGGLR